MKCFRGIIYRRHETWLMMNWLEVPKRILLLKKTLLMA